MVLIKLKRDQNLIRHDQNTIMFIESFSGGEFRCISGRERVVT